jgi:hypothetical protein
VSTVLKDLLAELAEDAKPYDVRVRALRAGKRRRLARRAAPGLIALAVLASVGLAVLRPTPGPERYEPALPPRISLPGYPAVVEPRPDAPWLSNDRAPGVGAIVYVDRTLGYFLVAADGAQYRLGKPQGPSAESYSLSPDHRWLVSAEPQARSRTMLRDLTAGTAWVEFPLYFTPVAWSPDGRWLVLGLYGGGDPGRVRLIDLHAPVIDPNGLEVDLHGFPENQVASVLGDGRLVLAKLGTYPLPDLTIVDPHTLEQHTVTVDIISHTSPEERQVLAESAAIRAMVGVTQNLTFTTDGRVLLQLNRSASTAEGPMIPGTSADVLVIDLERQVVIQRWKLPAPRPVPGGWETWWVSTMVPEGLLLSHQMTGRFLSLELFQPGTGQLFLVTDMTRLPSWTQ